MIGITKKSYKVKLFSSFYATMELEQFLNENAIAPSDIVSITMGCDAQALDRLHPSGINNILLVYLTIDKP